MKRVEEVGWRPVGRDVRVDFVDEVVGRDGRKTMRSREGDEGVDLGGVLQEGEGVTCDDSAHGVT